MTPGQPGIRVSGTKAGVRQALQEVQNLVKKIVTGEHVVSTPGMPQYFLDDRGNAFC